jgi:Leucine-rich repeat (LRR) protein
MKQLLLMIAVVVLVGCGEKEAAKKPTPKPPNAVPNSSDAKTAIEQAIRIAAREQGGVENIRILEIRSIQLTDINPLAALTQLESLMLFDCQLTDIRPLVKLTRLTYLNLHANKIEDVSDLIRLTMLKELYLDSNQITDVSGLSGLKQLERLHLRENYDLNKAQIAELQKALPDCTILH